jgi:hypothetical protein
MSDLEKFNDDYEDAETTRTFGVIPDGTYQVFVDGVKLTETKGSGKPMLAWTFKIMGGDMEGRLLFKNSVITEETLGYIKTDLSICELHLKKFSDLSARVFELLNMHLEIKVVNKTKVRNGNEEVSQNIYIQSKLYDDDDKMPTSDDIPF